MDYLQEHIQKRLVQYVKTDGSYRTNLGIDIQAKIGEPVVAVMDGKVKEVGTELIVKMVRWLQ